MNFEEFKRIFIEESKYLNLEISDEKLKLFFDYMKGIIEWNVYRETLY